MLAEILLKVLAWIITLIYFMVVTPLIYVIQALITPIEIVISCIRCKRIIDPDEYWRCFADSTINAYERWFDVLD